MRLGSKPFIFGVLILAFAFAPFLSREALAQKARYRCVCGPPSCGSSAPVDIDVTGMSAQQIENAVIEACTTGFCSTTGGFCRYEAVTVTKEAQEKDGVVSSEQVGCPPNTPPGTKCLYNPLGTKDVGVLVRNIINAGLGFVGALALLMFVYGGFLWLTSAGAADRVKQGKDAMTWAAIGLTIVFASYALVHFVFGAFTEL